MTDRVLIPLPGLGTLALSVDAYRAALAEGAATIGATAAPRQPDEPMIDAEQLAKVLSLPATAIERLAREKRIPFIECGRWKRFSRRAVEQALSRGTTAAASAA